MAYKLMGFHSGVTTGVFSPTSAYATFGEAPGTGRNLVLEVTMSPSTGTEPVDFRLVQGMARLDARTSDVIYTFASTTYTQKTSSFTINTTKNAFQFALQVRQSTDSTDFGTTVSAKWIVIS